MNRRRWTALLVSVVLSAATVACGSGAEATSGTSRAAEDSTACPPSSPSAALPAPADVRGHLRVLAAASLTGAFGSLAKAFSVTFPDAEVATSFGASSDLVARIHEGAPADVLATADTTTMATAVANGDVTHPATFTCNTMTILTAKGDPLGIRGLADLARHDVRFALCAAPVPCGRLGREVLANARVDATPVGSEANVEALVAKVTSGEIDAGIVYVTDAKAAKGEASSVAIPASANVTTAYPIAVTTQTDEGSTARAFVDFVRSPQGRRILRSYGFGVD